MNWSSRFSRFSAWAAAAITAACSQAAWAIDVPKEFEVFAITPQLTGPVGMAFAPDGRLFVAEQRGVVRVIEFGVELPSFFIDLRNEVGHAGDRGLLGIALDPAFAINRYVYLLYTVDPVFGQPDESMNDGAFCRVTRYTGTLATSGAVADPASRTVLIGQTAAEGIPTCWSSHTIGGLRWGVDGSLLVSVGDGAIFEFADAGGETPDCDGLLLPGEDIGAFRSQSLDSTNGKILRVDRATGLGLAGNPYFTGDPAAIRSKVFVSGLRNPFRFAVRPGSPPPGGTLYISDVGWNDFEEISAARGGDNLGWPCYEGVGQAPDYPGFSPAVGGCDTIETPDNPGPLVFPILDFHHFEWRLSHPQGPTGQAAMAGVFHMSPTYPAPFRNGFFYADFIQGWMKHLKVDSKDRFVDLTNFASNGMGPVDFALHPIDGDLCYLSLYEQTAYQIRSLIRPGDANRDGDVNVDDILEVINAWGPCPWPCWPDLDGGGAVNVDDLLEVINNWG